MRKLFAMVVFAIIYGSLFPFDVDYIGWSMPSWQILFSSWDNTGGLGDLLGNIILFIPFGLFGFHALKNGKTGYKKHQIILLSAFLLAFFLQVLQIQIPSRTPELSDVIWNMVGTIIGLLLTLKIFRRYIPENIEIEKINIPHILAFLWIVYLLVPFVPTLDVREIKDSLKPIFFDPRIKIDEILIIMSGWLIFATLSRGFFTATLLSRFLLPIALAFTLTARVFIYSNHLSLADVIGGFLALSIWTMGFGKLPNKSRILFWLLVISLAFKGLSPFQYSLKSLNDFSWLPFAGMLSGDMLNNAASLVQKIFLYTSLLWFMKKAYAAIRFKTAAILAFLFLIEVAQSYSFSHSAEITDPFLLLMLALILKGTKQKFDPYSQHKSPISPPEEKISSGPDTTHPLFKSFLVKFFLSILIIAAVISTILTLPKIPYNVRELFLLQGSFLAIIPFATALLWFGISIPLMGFLLLKSPGKHYLKLPALSILSLWVSYILLTFSVTDESLRDITGSTKFLTYLADERVWGSFGVGLARLVNSPSLMANFETFIRFFFLLAPLNLLLCIFYLGFEWIKIHQIKHSVHKIKLFSLAALQYGLYGLPWFWLSKYTAFDKATTDNLNELIEREGIWGLGGGVALYILIILLCFNAAYLVQSSAKIKPTLFTIFALVTGWFLFNAGLEDEVHKYGNVFSGVDFLLGPDRKELLDGISLFSRWIFVYVGAVAILVWGMRVAKPHTAMMRAKRDD